MVVQLGVIADDFTGATDIASSLVENGIRTVQLNGINEVSNIPSDTDAVVISLKSRSNPAADAVRLSLDALRFLQHLGINRFYFKYCSTFDSTPAGNIGPVTDALLSELGEDFTVVCPSLPVNGRTTYLGYLFVDEVPLHESGMRDHPVTPMRDSNLMRLMERQSEGRAKNVPSGTVDEGVGAVRDALAELRHDEVRYAVLDAINDEHLQTLGEALIDSKLVTGGSGLAGAIAGAMRTRELPVHAGEWVPLEGRGVVLSGSSSVMTNKQVEDYRHRAPSFEVSVGCLLADPSSYANDVVNWVLEQPANGPAPIVFATGKPDQVRHVQETFGSAVASDAIEGLFATVAQGLCEAGTKRFIVAGGETSGSVTTALGVSGFQVGPEIAPGVPWVRSLSGDVDLALKSGNFGTIDFFIKAQHHRV